MTSFLNVKLWLALNCETVACTGTWDILYQDKIQISDAKCTKMLSAAFCFYTDMSANGAVWKWAVLSKAAFLIVTKVSHQITVKDL